MGAKKIKFPNWGLQSKIIILFLIIFSVVATTAYFVRENERILRQSLNNLSQPDEKISHLHKILSILPQAENRLRFYTLTNNDIFFYEYELLIDSVNSNIRILRENFVNDSLTNKQLDSVTALISERKLLIQSFLEIQKKHTNYNLPDRAIKTIKKGTPDSIIKQKETTTTTITTYDTVEPIATNTEEKSKGNGLLSKIKKVFTRDNDTKTPEVAQDSVVKSVTRIQTDTVAISLADTLGFHKIEQQLTQIWSQDLRNYNQLRKQELDMLQNSSLLIDQITNIFRRLEVSIETGNQLSSLAARNRATKSLLLIGLINLFALALIVILVVLILNSIRKSNRYRKELFLANMQAIELAKVKEEFLANMSHEMRTPLNAIIGFSDLLSNTDLDNSQNKYLQAVRKSSRHLLETVNDILDLTRLAAGKFQISESDFSLKTLLEDVLSPFKLEAEEKGLLFIIECNGLNEVILRGDPLRLKQILYNLLSNAVKFTLEGSITIKCELQVNDPYLETTIIITDTGIGIPGDKLESIFEDFQQLESTSARSYGGSGLGLAISRRLARVQNGDITVESEIGKGSSFKVKINYLISEKPVDLNEHKQPITDAEVIHSKNILVVDDDVFNTLLVKIIGDNHGFNIHLASDGYIAQKLIEQEKFHLVMTDLQMPGFTGSELVKYIRNHPKKEIAEMPVIAFTANKIERFDEKLISSGFNEVMQKPFTEEEFIERALSYLTDRNTSVNENSLEINENLKNMETTVKPYNLDQILLFSSGKKDQIINIIQTFINTAEQSLAQMKAALKRNDYAEIKEIAHRLLTSYAHFNIYNCLPILEELDKSELRKIDKKRVSELLNELERNSGIIFDLMSSEITEITRN